MYTSVYNHVVFHLFKVEDTQYLRIVPVEYTNDYFTEFSEVYKTNELDKFTIYGLAHTHHRLVKDIEYKKFKNARLTPVVNCQTIWKVENADEQWFTQELKVYAERKFEGYLDDDPFDIAEHMRDVIDEIYFDVDKYVLKIYQDEKQQLYITSARLIRMEHQTTEDGCLVYIPSAQDLFALYVFGGRYCKFLNGCPESIDRDSLVATDSNGNITLTDNTFTLQEIAYIIEKEFPTTLREKVTSLKQYNTLVNNDNLELYNNWSMNLPDKGKTEKQPIVYKNQISSQLYTKCDGCFKYIEEMKVLSSYATMKTSIGQNLFSSIVDSVNHENMIDVKSDIKQCVDMISALFSSGDGVTDPKVSKTQRDITELYVDMFKSSIEETMASKVVDDISGFLRNYINSVNIGQISQDLVTLGIQKKRISKGNTYGIRSPSQMELESLKALLTTMEPIKNYSSMESIASISPPLTLNNLAGFHATSISS